MTPVTTERRALGRTDGRRRPATPRPAASRPTLFDVDPATAGHATAAAPEPAVAAPEPAELESAPERPSTAEAAAVPAAVRASAEPAALVGSGETLDRLVVGSWERLAARAGIPCLLCGGAMEPAYGAHAIPIGGRCRDCATILS